MLTAKVMILEPWLRTPGEAIFLILSGERWREGKTNGKMKERK